ncbi:MAG: aminodeoxychorismate synthase component [Pseudomonadota bacterium]
MSVHIVRQNVVFITNRHTLLTALQSLHGVVWLFDQQDEVVGFCPKHWIQQTATATIAHYCRDRVTGQPTTYERNSTDWTAAADALLHSAADWMLPSLDGFKGGLMGFVGYDVAASHHVSVAHQAQTCGAALGLYDSFFRLETDGWRLYGPDEVWDEQAQQQLIQCVQHATLPAPSTLMSPFVARWTRSQYDHAFAQIQQYLKAGDCYQVNLTQPFDATWSGAALPLLAPLMTLTRAPFSGYLACGDLEILSCSPELFIAFEPAGVVVTRPIKGTAPRLSDPTQDAASKQQLMDSDKDRSENLMIVDLLRNDLSVHAQTGSVRVPTLFEVESFAQVHHLVSEIRAVLKPDQSPLRLLMDALPGGSITGAPKVRAMQIIAELEAGPRGAYCGSLGYLNADGTGRFNILIRTIQRTGNQLQAWVGGGITIASNADSEYQECLDKISAILDCVNQWPNTPPHSQ